MLAAAGVRAGQVHYTSHLLRRVMLHVDCSYRCQRHAASITFDLRANDASSCEELSYTGALSAVCNITYQH